MPGGAVNAPDMQACFCWLGEQVEATVKGPGVEVPEHCAFEKRFMDATVLLVHESVPHWVTAPPPEGVMGKQPILEADVAMVLPEQSAVEKVEVCR